MAVGVVSIDYPVAIGVRIVRVGAPDASSAFDENHNQSRLPSGGSGIGVVAVACFGGESITIFIGTHARATGAAAR